MSIFYWKKVKKGIKKLKAGNSVNKIIDKIPDCVV